MEAAYSGEFVPEEEMDARFIVGIVVPGRERSERTRNDCD
jgi:hypothetical protein